MAKKQTSRTRDARQAELRRTLFGNDFRYWKGQYETGYFCAPRTLPLVLDLLGTKDISGNLNPSSVYVELISRQMGEGIVEIGHEMDHANASGYHSTRAVKSWRDRMRILESFGFIKSAPKGDREFGYVLIIHPSVAVEALIEKKMVDQRWLNSYTARQLEVGEAVTT